MILSESPDEALSKFTVPLGYVYDSLLFEHGLNWVSIMSKQKPKQGNLLVVQWLGLSAVTTGAWVQSLVRTLRFLQNSRGSKKKKQKKNLMPILLYNLYYINFHLFTKWHMQVFT